MNLYLADWYGPYLHVNTYLRLWYTVLWPVWHAVFLTSLIYLPLYVYVILWFTGSFTHGVLIPFFYWKFCWSCTLDVAFTAIHRLSFVTSIFSYWFYSWPFTYKLQRSLLLLLFIHIFLPYVFHIYFSSNVIVILLSIIKNFYYILLAPHIFVYLAFSVCGAQIQLGSASA